MPDELEEYPPDVEEPLSVEEMAKRRRSSAEDRMIAEAVRRLPPVNAISSRLDGSWVMLGAFGDTYLVAATLPELAEKILSDPERFGTY